MNLYSYVTNNPGNWSDPYGLLAVAMGNPVAVGADGVVPVVPQYNNGSADKSRDSGVPWSDIGNYARDQSGGFGKGEKDCPEKGNGYNAKKKGKGKKWGEKGSEENPIQDYGRLGGKNWEYKGPPKSKFGKGLWDFLRLIGQFFSGTFWTNP